ncbi:Edc3p SCDLUD_003411 [Saccharomycodes ludwigii]|uniref:Edc3p n=1 Tax=Saccharomycodes ludwigii TaxID=36035 RepID=UPI001E8A12E6|nr:hypothetical protein SCDLUD_003411 [Saccharomycodes ludwigii]KAH3900430.1 hypothetical protein SCDLUD_003411 [Saccharomycodes ludwigii]
MSQFSGFGVKVELQDGKIITGKINKCTSKSLILNDVKFSDGGTSAIFKVKSSRLKDLSVISVPPKKKYNNNTNNINIDDNTGSTNLNGNQRVYFNTLENSSQNNRELWGDDDVQKIKESSDFDFASNLAMFNKKSVFEQLKQKDQIDPSKRLVSFNKKGIDDINGNGMKATNVNNNKINYENHEMVLADTKNDYWDSIDSMKNHENGDISGKTNSDPRDNTTGVTATHDSSVNDKNYDSTNSTATTNSNNVDYTGNFSPITKSINITHLLKRGNTATTTITTHENHNDSSNENDVNATTTTTTTAITNTNNDNNNNNNNNNNDDIGTGTGKNDASNYNKTTSATTQDVLEQIQKVLSNVPPSDINSISTKSRRGSSYNSNTINCTSPLLSISKCFQETRSKEYIPTSTPLQLLEIDRLASDEYNFSYSLQVEHVAIHLSTFIKKRKLGGNVRLNKKNNNAPPLVVILCSMDSKCSIQAIAIGRTLCQTKHVRVLTCMYSGTNSDVTTNGGSRNSNGSNLYELEMNKQLELYKKCGGKIVGNTTTLENVLSKLNSPVELIIDGIQGYDCNLEDLVQGTDYNDLIEMIDWCNSKTAASTVNHEHQCECWSLELPSGVDPNTGDCNFITTVIPNTVVSLGLPLSVLLNDNLSDKDNNSSNKTYYLVDMGIPSGVFNLKNTLRKFVVMEEVFAVDGVVQIMVPPALYSSFG